MSNLSTASKNQYDLYMRSITDLAQSIVIKFDALAQGINTTVLIKTGQLADQANPASWKYYQNICGRYHSTDTMMSVYSLDSESIIDFTVEQLQTNPLTRAAYAFGSSYYKDLLAQYPDQEMLILGILYPADMQTALAAKDGAILSYPTHLVEDAEVDLMGLLQTWIYAYTRRWLNNGFMITDNLYFATFYAQLIMHLVGIVSNLRLAACKTNQAHSFHIAQYLRSHGFLDVYLNQMTRKQVLTMYRNIHYYERNAGFDATFKELLDVVFTEAGMPVYGYQMLHNQGSLSHETTQDTQYLHSIARFQREPLNEIARTYPKDSIGLTQLHALTATQTPYNNAFQQAQFDQVNYDLSISKNAQLTTKVIECATRPIIRASTQTPDAILFNQWIDWVAQGRFAVPVNYVPEGDESPVRLTHQQAVAVWAYAQHKALQPETQSDYPELVRVPLIQLNRVLRTPKPSIDELVGVVTYPDLDRQLLQQLLDTAPVVPVQITSLTHFQQVCGQIYQGALDQYSLYSYQQNPLARGSGQIAASRLYADKVVRLADLADSEDPTQGMLYSTLLQQLGLNFNGYRPIDYYNTAARILNAATGSQLNNLSDPTNVQGAMINLMRYLSSYSIQIVATGAAGDRIIVAHPDIRAYKARSSLFSTYRVDVGFATVLGTAAHKSTRASIQTAKLRAYVTTADTRKLFLTVNAISKTGTRTDTAKVSALRVGVSLRAPNIDPHAQFMALTQQQRESYVDIYRR